MSRTPHPLRLVRAVPAPVRWLAPPALLGTGLLLTTVLAGPWEPPLTAPHPDAKTAGYCRALARVLPRDLQGHPRAATSPSPYVVAWASSPRTVLRCGVPRPKSLAVVANRESVGPNVDGVQWYVESDGHGGSRLTTTELSMYVELSVPLGSSSQYPLPAVSEAVRSTVPDLSGRIATSPDTEPDG
ncbi:hypothetical protein GCM10009760_43110 [Kitasatospora kazusensis]|uniref:DUF3515 domain-containing protein n=1 Tax=Kitasatospora kazusensis TaxID=407974 RepID=A0ABN2ZZ45_9ACTN